MTEKDDFIETLDTIWGDDEPCNHGKEQDIGQGKVECLECGLVWTKIPANSLIGWNEVIQDMNKRR